MMQRFLSKTLLISLLLVVATGVLAVAALCGGGMHGVVGMSDCPELVTHHILAFTALFAASAVTMQLFLPTLAAAFASATGMTLTLMPHTPPPAQMLRRRESLDIPEDPIRLLLARGRLHRRSDSGPLHY